MRNGKVVFVVTMSCTWLTEEEGAERVDGGAVVFGLRLTLKLEAVEASRGGEGPSPAKPNLNLILAMKPLNLLTFWGSLLLQNFDPIS